MDSILNTIKKMLGIEIEDAAFDTDIIVFINSAIAILTQNGIGPANGFRVTGPAETWTSIVPNNKYNLAKDYIYLYVRRLFDPPANSFVMDAMNKQLEENLIRLNIQNEYDEQQGSE